MARIEIFTDGACSGNPGAGGWGAILRYKDTEKELEYVLRMLADKGEKRVFRYLRKKVRKARTRKVNNFIGGLARG